MEGIYFYGIKSDGLHATRHILQLTTKSSRHHEHMHHKHHVFTRIHASHTSAFKQVQAQCVTRASLGPRRRCESLRAGLPHHCIKACKLYLLRRSCAAPRRVRLLGRPAGLHARVRGRNAAPAPGGRTVGERPAAGRRARCVGGGRGRNPGKPWHRAGKGHGGCRGRRAGRGGHAAAAAGRRAQLPHAAQQCLRAPVLPSLALAAQQCCAPYPSLARQPAPLVS